MKETLQQSLDQVCITVNCQFNDKTFLFIYVYMYKRNLLCISACSVATEFIGRLAAEWNHPMFPTSGSYPVLDNKDVFKTLTRLSYNSKGLSQFLVQFISLFNWTDITIMHEPYGKRFHPQLYRYNTAWAENIHKNIKIAGVTSTPVQFSSETKDGLSKALKEASRTARGNS